MALDALEKERLRKKMALRMAAFVGTDKSVTCVSAHVYDEPQVCELSQQASSDEMLVIRNRAGKTMKVCPYSLKEMVRFQVTEIEDFPKWLEKLKELRVHAEKRKEEKKLQREEERKKLEKKVIVRKKPSDVPA